MKKNITLIAFCTVITFLLMGCNKESEFDKAVREGAEQSKQMAGTNRPIPRVILELDNPKPTKEKEK